MNENWRIEATTAQHVRSTASGAENEGKDQEGWIRKYSRYSWTVKCRYAPFGWEVVPHDGADDGMVCCKCHIDRQDF